MRVLSCFPPARTPPPRRFRSRFGFVLQEAFKASISTGVGKSVLLVDHEDSFVHTLGNYLRQTGAEVTTNKLFVKETVFLLMCDWLCVFVCVCLSAFSFVLINHGGG